MGVPLCPVLRDRQDKDVSTPQLERTAVKGAAATAAPRPHQPLYPVCAPGEERGITATMLGSGWALASPFWDHVGLKQVGGQRGRVSAAGGPW